MYNVSDQFENETATRVLLEQGAKAV